MQLDNQTRYALSCKTSGAAKQCVQAARREKAWDVAPREQRDAFRFVDNGEGEWPEWLKEEHARRKAKADARKAVAKAERRLGRKVEAARKAAAAQNQRRLEVALNNAKIAELELRLAVLAAEKLGA